MSPQASQTAQPRCVSLIALAILCTGGLISYFAWYRYFAPPLPNCGLSIPDDCLNFGKAWETNSFEWTVPITNHGDSNLQILAFRASCACASLKPQSFQLGPGDSASVLMTFDLTKGGQEQSVASERPFDVLIVPVIKDRHIQQLGWKVSGFVKTPLQIQPTSVDFQENLIRGQQLLPKTVAAKAKISLSMVRANCNHPHFTVDINRKDGNANNFEVVVSPQPGIGAGRVDFPIDLVCTAETGEILPVIRLPVRGYVHEDVRAFPANVSWGATCLEETMAETILLKSSSGKPFRIREIKGLSDSVKARILMPADGSFDEVSISVNVKISQTRDYNHDIVIVLDTHDQKRVELPVRLHYFGVDNSR